MRGVLFLLGLLAAGPALAQPQQAGCAQPGACAQPANPRDAARAPRQAAARPPAPSASDITGGRFVPPAVVQALSTPRVDPDTRALILALAARPFDSWSVADLTAITAIAPVLVEVGVPERALRELYEALGMDPGNLFDPQLGNAWQAPQNEFDPRNNRRRQGVCPQLSTAVRLDPASVRVQDLILCAEQR